jgi:hypothetical protein
MVQRQPRQIVQETLSQKNKTITKKAGGVALGVGPEFSTSPAKKKKKIYYLQQVRR